MDQITIRKLFVEAIQEAIYKNDGRDFNELLDGFKDTSVSEESINSAEYLVGNVIKINTIGNKSSSNRNNIQEDIKQLVEFCQHGDKIGFKLTEKVFEYIISKLSFAEDKELLKYFLSAIKSKTDENIIDTEVNQLIENASNAKFLNSIYLVGNANFKFNKTKQVNDEIDRILQSIKSSAGFSKYPSLTLAVEKAKSGSGKGSYIELLNKNDNLAYIFVTKEKATLHICADVVNNQETHEIINELTKCFMSLWPKSDESIKTIGLNKELMDSNLNKSVNSASQKSSQATTILNIFFKNMIADLTPSLGLIKDKLETLFDSNTVSNSDDKIKSSEFQAQSHANNEVIISLVSKSLKDTHKIFVITEISESSLQYARDLIASGITVQFAWDKFEDSPEYVNKMAMYLKFVGIGAMPQAKNSNYKNFYTAYMNTCGHLMPGADRDIEHFQLADDKKRLQHMAIELDSGNLSKENVDKIFEFVRNYEEFLKNGYDAQTSHYRGKNLMLIRPAVNFVTNRLRTLSHEEHIADDDYISNLLNGGIDKDSLGLLSIAESQIRDEFEKLITGSKRLGKIREISQSSSKLLNDYDRKMLLKGHITENSDIMLNASIRAMSVLDKVTSNVTLMQSLFAVYEINETTDALTNIDNLGIAFEKFFADLEYLRKLSPGKGIKSQGASRIRRASQIFRRSSNTNSVGASEVQSVETIKVSNSEKLVKQIKKVLAVSATFYVEFHEQGTIPDNAHTLGWRKIVCSTNDNPVSEDNDAFPDEIPSQDDATDSEKFQSNRQVCFNV